MDVVLKTGNGRFNFRVCAIITNSGKLLAMRDENAPYYYCQEEEYTCTKRRKPQSCASLMKNSEFQWKSFVCYG